VTKYQILTANSIHDLKEKVNAEIVVLGWYPVGGITWDGSHYLQAMILEK
jgi:hypothetical protein